MKPIDPVRIKQAVKDGQLFFYIHEQWNGIFIYCKDATSEECVCVGEVKAESEGENADSN